MFRVVSGLLQIQAENNELITCIHSSKPLKKNLKESLEFWAQGESSTK